MSGGSNAPLESVLRESGLSRASAAGHSAGYPLGRKGQARRPAVETPGEVDRCMHALVR
jgi:hypothetical protein